MAGNVGGEGEDEIVGINVTPLVDIVLVLLIIFMVTANMIVRETVEVDLPSPAVDQNEQEKPPPPVMVVMDKDANLFIDGVAVPQGDLLTKLKEAGKGDPKARAVIDADPDLNYANVVNLIDMVKEAGISKFALNLKKERPAEGAPAPAPAPAP
jgi:biopolymer transport protein ExbD